MNISQKIYNLRKQNGYSQDELAEKIGVSSEVVADWENGVTPELAKVVELSNALNVSTDYLLKDDVNDNIKDDIRDSASQEVETSEEVNEVNEVNELKEEKKTKILEETVAGVRTLTIEDIKYYLESKSKCNKQIYYCIMFAVIGTLVPLEHYEFDVYEMFNLNQGTILKIFSILVMCISIFIALVCLVRAMIYNISELENFTLRSSAEEELEKMYEEFKISRNSILKSDLLIFIATTVGIFVSMVLFYESDFIMYLTIDLAIIVYTYAGANAIYIVYQNADYVALFQSIEDEERKSERKIEKVRRSKAAKTADGIEILTASDVETYINNRKKRGEDELDVLIIVATIALMPLAYFNFNVVDFFNLTGGDFFTEDTIWRIIGYIIFGSGTYLFVKGIIDFIREEESELNKNSVFVFKPSAEEKLKEMYETAKKERKEWIGGTAILLIASDVIYLFIIFFFDIGRVINTILLDVILFIIGVLVALLVDNSYQEAGYKVLFKNIETDEAEKIKILEKSKAKENLRNDRAMQRDSKKAGVKILNSTELDTYINNKVRYGKNIGRAVIFFVLACMPFIPYLYSQGQLLNSTALDNAPRVMFILSNVCIFIGLYFICVSVAINYKFGLNINYQFMFNEFAENKLKFLYGKFKTKRIGWILLAVVLYTSAIILTTYLVIMFNGSLYMFYGLLGVTMFLYAFATYFVISIKYEQKAYKVLLTNVD